MRLLVLGSGAGGGLPQWNAPNRNGRAAFGRDPLVPCRTQCSIAVSLDGEDWAVFNASPDLRTQILAQPQLHPRHAPRSSPIKAVALTGGEIDQVTGLLTLRERQAFTLFASAPTLQALAMNPIFDALADGTVSRVETRRGETFMPLPGLEATPLDIPGKAPLYLERTRSDPTASEAGDCFAYVIAHGGKRAVFAPGVARMTPALEEACRGADLVLFDGTLFTDDEMIAAGEGAKTGRRMGHMPMTGAASAVEAFAALDVRRKMFIHINNTNPAARADSAERRQLAALGWEIAEDGQDITL